MKPGRSFVTLQQRHPAGGGQSATPLLRVCAWLGRPDSLVASFQLHVASDSGRRLCPTSVNAHRHNLCPTSHLNGVGCAADVLFAYQSAFDFLRLAPGPLLMERSCARHKEHIRGMPKRNLVSSWSIFGRGGLSISFTGSLLRLHALRSARSLLSFGFAHLVLVRQGPTKTPIRL